MGVKYPLLEINLEKLKTNIRKVVSLCEELDIEVTGVTKAFCGNKEIAKTFLDCGIKTLADSRIKNLKKIQNLKCEKLLLRIPMKSEIEDVIKYSDIALVSEIEIIREIGKESVKNNKTYKVILMIDLGDLREGVLEENVENIIKEVLNIEGIDLYGIGTNLTCYGGVIPEESNLEKLEVIKNKIENKFNKKLSIISGGNSSSLPLVINKKIPKGINNLRIGEGILLGRETSYGKRIKETFNDVFILKGELIEVKNKPSVPKGKIGFDVFGNKPIFKDEGIIKRGIVAIGKQDLDINSLITKDLDVKILGASSDHLLLNLSNSKIDYKLGDIIEFKLGYGALLMLMTSEYVEKIYV